ncbi:hypothetical protein MASR2M18_02200 [Ignavibacteria bacterium]
MAAQSMPTGSPLQVNRHNGFIENRGQWNSSAKFLAQFPSVNAWIDTTGGIRFDMFAYTSATRQRSKQPRRFSEPQTLSQKTFDGEVFQLNFGGRTPHGTHRLPGSINYLKGDNATDWTRNAKSFSTVEIPATTGNVNLSLGGGTVSEKSDITLTAEFSSPAEATGFYLTAKGKYPILTDGYILFKTQAGTLSLAAPSAMQKMPDGELLPVKCTFVLTDDSVISFRFENAEHSQPIVLAVPMIFSIVEGGASNEICYATALDTMRAAYVTGKTMSQDFPVTNGAYSGTLKSKDCFVVKYNSAGNGVVYATFLGGSTDETGNGITVDASGSAYITGITSSNDFPATAGAFQTKRRDNPASPNTDCFIAKLAPDGGSLVFATYLGGKQADVANGIAIDFAGASYICGQTTSGAFGPQDSFPTTQKAFSRTHNGGAEDGFVAKISPDGSNLVYCSYLGGDGGDYTNALALGSDGTLYVTGGTLSPKFPRTPFTVGQRVKGEYECFISKFSKDADSLHYSVVIGGEGSDVGTGIAADIFGNAYVAGYTASKEFPVTQGALDTAFNSISKSSRDAFVLKLTPKADTMLYSTFLGGTGDDEARGISIDVCGAAYIAGTTYSPNFPTTPDALDATLNNGATEHDDAFVAKINSDGNTLIYSSYIGGTNNDEASCIAVDATGAVCLGGTTYSPDFVKTSQFGNMLKSNVFLTKLQVGILPLSPDISPGGPTKFCDGGEVTLSTATNYRLYQWKFDGSDIPGATAPQISATKNGRYTVAVTDASGCTGAKDIMITVYPRPSVSAGGDVLICPDSSIRLRAVTTDSIISYQWSPATGLSSVNTPSPIANPRVTTDYIVTVTDVNKCVNSDTVRIVVVNPNDITLKQIPDTLFACPGDSLTTQIFARNSGEMNINADFISSDPRFRVQNPIVSVPAHDSIPVRIIFIGSAVGGSFSSRITVTDVCGNVKTENTAVFVGVPDTRIQAAADTTICLGEIALRQITVRNLARTPATLTISGSGGKFSSLTSEIQVGGKDSSVFSVSFSGENTAGRYSAVFYLDDQCGGRDSVAVSIIVKGTPIVIRPSGSTPAEAPPGITRIVGIAASDLVPLNESPNKTMEFTLLYDKTTLVLDSIISSQCSVSFVRQAIGKALIRLENCSDTVFNPLVQAVFSSVVGETLTPTVQITDVVAGDKCIAPGASPADTVKMIPYGCEIRTLNVQLFSTALQAVYPSPADEVLTAEYSTVEETVARFTLVGVLGQTIRTLAETTQKPGTYQARFSMSDIPHGNYMLVMEAGRYRTAYPVIIAR